MAGIGKYKKGAKFTLKSGNSPAFKMMGTPESGDSPITNEFGIGKGTSPYKVQDEITPKLIRSDTKGQMGGRKDTTLSTDTSKEVRGLEIKTKSSDKFGGKATDVGGKKPLVPKAPEIKVDKKAKRKAGWKKAAQIGLAALTGGLDAVYGSGKIMPSGSARLIKKKKEDKDNKEAVVTTKTAGQSVLENVQKKQTATIEPE